MRDFLGAALMLIASQGVAFADTISSSVGNTVVARFADGTTSEMRLHADGTYTQTTPGGGVVSGTWTNQGGEFCQTPQGGQASCTALPEGKNVGDTWNDTDPSGAQATFAIVAGQ